MSLDFITVDALRTHHPGWRLLRAEHAPLITSFLHRAFILPNRRTIAAADLAEALDDELFELRRRLGPDTFPRTALDYLNEWADTDKGWLRKFYAAGSDEPQFDLTPATEKAIAWLGSLMERSFVGTESRLKTLFDLLKQMSEGSEADPDKRLAELQKRRDDIDIEMARVLAGQVSLLDDVALKDRFQQFMQLARDLLTDFREVEHNFRLLDRRVRERIALWEGGKGTLLEEIMGEHDAITDSDQGRSFRAFWDFLMSSRRQEELSELLDHVLTLPPVADLKPDVRTRRVHYDWLEAGEHTQRTVARLSQQLRRFLDDRAWLENRRIMDLLHRIESNALALRDTPPQSEWMTIVETGADIELPMERPLFTPVVKPRISDVLPEAGNVEIDAGALFSQVVVDRAQLMHHIRQALQQRAQVTLRELTDERPIQQGLAEVVAYLQLGSDAFRSVVDENIIERITWEVTDEVGKTITKQAQLPRVIFVR